MESQQVMKKRHAASASAAEIGQAADAIRETLEELGVTTEQALEALERVRREMFEQRYPHLADKAKRA